MQNTPNTLLPPVEQGVTTLKLESVTEIDVLTQVRQTRQIPELTHQIQCDRLVYQLCQQLDVQISDDELQMAGNMFRSKHKLLGIPETLAWLADQQITVEDWTADIRRQLQWQKLAENLFGQALDSHYMANRDNYRRVALSQIVVSDLAMAQQIAQELQGQPTNLGALALEHSQNRLSRSQGGFVGIHYLTEFASEIIQAITDREAGDIIGPVEGNRGYHILRIEKWFPPYLNEKARQSLLQTTLQSWLDDTLQNLSSEPRQEINS
ncbi:parvulin-like peptidyl-prolyl isomerase [Leptolyngbya sp. PCC 7375]|nr:parvulin-like peptidyl-prolyl isomerase [Leptolyngbya sp. PCC 7375]